MVFKSAALWTRIFRVSSRFTHNSVMYSGTCCLVCSVGFWLAKFEVFLEDGAFSVGRDWKMYAANSGTQQVAESQPQNDLRRIGTSAYGVRV